ncbi:MAG: hypothetical protein C5B49_10545 [Bdellovibrio sp.]|nr:MAG: hypothetical protein C5B49_10545 [Bdellovibrio sp.]
MKSLNVTPLQTEIFRRGQDLHDFIVNAVPRSVISEKMVLCVTSKIVSLAEGRCIHRSQVTSKSNLVLQEADVFLGEIGYGCFLTVKEGLFIASAGIDESNSENGDYILFPKNPQMSAQTLWTRLRESWTLHDLGILLTDSHTSPLRQGVTGVALGYWGFRAVRDMIGSKDIFGRELKMTKMNFADGLASAAVMMMGEGSERQPLAVIHGADLDFCDQVDTKEIRMPLEEDLYFPMIRPFMEG